MLRLLLFMGVLLIFGCDKPKPKYPLPDAHDIHGIIKAIVEQENIVDLFDNNTGILISRQKGKKNFITLKDFPLSVNLLKVRVDVSGSTAFQSMPYLELIASKYFNKTDSAYLFFQNDTLSHFEVDTAAMHGMKFTSELKLKHEWNMGHHNSQYYKVSIPIFSLDRKFVRVQLDAISGSIWEPDMFFICER